MRTPSAKRIKEVLDKHGRDFCPSHYTEKNVSSETRHCLLSWMALEAGIALPPSHYNTHVIGMTGTQRFAVELRREYGLSLHQLKELQFANDDAPGFEELERHVVELLNQWCASPNVAA